MKFKPVLRFARDAVINIAIPFAIYTFLQPRFGDVDALIAASAPPILWSLAEFIRAKTVDALSLIVLLGIGLSLAAYFGGGSVRFLQLREKLVTILIALGFLGSALIGRPIMYEVIRAFLARNQDPELARLEMIKNQDAFRRSMTIMTLVWGFGLLGDGLLSIALVFVLPIRIYLVVNPILGYATIGLLTVWNVLYGRQRRRVREAAEKSAKANQVGAPNPLGAMADADTIRSAA